MAVAPAPVFARLEITYQNSTLVLLPSLPDNRLLRVFEVLGTHEGCGGRLILTPSSPEWDTIRCEKCSNSVSMRRGRTLGDMRRLGS